MSTLRDRRIEFGRRVAEARRRLGVLTRQLAREAPAYTGIRRHQEIRYIERGRNGRGMTRALVGWLDGRLDLQLSAADVASLITPGRP